MGVVKMLPAPTSGPKPLPHNIDAEQAVLGALMLDNTLFEKVSALLEPEDFYERVHGAIYDIISVLIMANKPATPVTMVGYMGEIDMGEINPQAYLSELCANSISPKMAPDYARFIRDQAASRKIFIIAESVQRRVLEQSAADSPIQILDDMESQLAALRPRDALGGQSFSAFDVAVDEAMAAANAAYGNVDSLSGLATSLTKLDDCLGGLNKGDLVIIGGRPAMGKTALAINIAYNIARGLSARRAEGQKTGVIAINSLEMTRSQLASRILSEHSRVSGWRLRKGQVSEAELTGFLDAGDILRKLPIHIDASAGLKISTLAMRARALKKRFGLELLVVDYLQLLKGSGSHGSKDFNRVNEVTEITGMLKQLAKELDIPVIALSQLSRKSEEREDKRPQIGDLRESGSIEQDADSILLLYREEFYLKKQEPRKGSAEHNDWTSQMEAAHARGDVIVAKNRHGPEDTIELGYDANLTLFHNDVPEAVAAQTAAREKRPKTQALRLIPEATAAYQFLGSLMLMKSISNDGVVDKAGKDTKLVLYEDWKDRCAAELLDPEATDKQKVNLMEKIVKILQAPGGDRPPMIGRGGPRNASYVWRTETK